MRICRPWLLFAGKDNSDAPKSLASGGLDQPWQGGIKNPLS
jgi:hypothetical protein